MAARKAKASAASEAVDAIHRALQGKQIPEGEWEGLMRAAVDIINRDYYDDVRGLAQDVIRQIKDGEITSRDDLQERLHELIDSSQRVMYTWQARLGLLATDNIDAYEESFGEPPKGPEQQMFAALEADVQEQLEAEDVDELLRKARSGDEDDD